MKTKFLLIRFSSIGDIVLTSPVVRCLKLQFAQAEIHFLTKKHNADLLMANPYIDKIQLLDKSLAETIGKLKDEKYDYIIDLHNNLRSLRVKLGLNIKSFSFTKLNINKFLLTSFKIHTMPDGHIVDRNLATLQHFKVENDGKGLDHFIAPADEILISQLPLNFQNGYVAIVLAGTYATKKTPVEKFRQLVLANYPCILLGAKSEHTMAATIMDWNMGTVLDYTGKLRINQSASLVKNARLVITNDTGLMHIAAAFHKKILSIWGNTVPELGMPPYMPGQGSEILEIKGLSCRPCSKLGYKECPKKHFRCMNDLSGDSILAWVKREFDKA